MTELLITLLTLILPPCPEEDSTWCHWDATQQGNGQGSSFITLSEGVVLSFAQATSPSTEVPSVLGA